MALKITDLNPVVTPALTDEFEVAQSGAPESRRETLSQIATLLQTNLPDLSSANQTITGTTDLKVVSPSGSLRAGTNPATATFALIWNSTAITCIKPTNFNNDVTFSAGNTVTFSSTTVSFATHPLLNEGFSLRDSGADHYGAIILSNDLTADRNYNLTLPDADTDISLGDWFDQSVKTTASPTFVNVSADTIRLNDSNDSHYSEILIGSDLTANRTFTLVTGDADRQITLSGNPTLDDWFDQAVKTSSDVTFNEVTTDKILGKTTDGTLTVEPNGDGDIRIYFNNDNVSGGENVVIEQDGTGDACLNFLLTGQQTINIGLDNSDNDYFKICVGSSGLDTTTGLAWDRTEAWYPQADDTYSWGKSGNLWTAVWAKNGTIQTSDENAKENIQNIGYGLDFINSLRPVVYNWKPKDADPQEVQDQIRNRKHAGFVGQDIKSLIDSNDFPNIANTIIEEENNFLGMNYVQIIPYLVKAIQELSLKIQSNRLETK